MYLHLFLLCQLLILHKLLLLHHMMLLERRDLWMHLTLHWQC